MSKQSEIQQILRSSLIQTHPSNFEPSAENNVYILLDTATDYHQHPFGTYFALQILLAVDSFPVLLKIAHPVS